MILACGKFICFLWHLLADATCWVYYLCPHLLLAFVCSRGILHAKPRPQRAPKQGANRMKPSGPRHINWSAIPLGKVTDAEAARLAGTTPAAATYARKRLGLPRFFKDDATEIDWTTTAIGKRKDKDVAAELNVSVATVRNARKVRGIPACRPGPGEPGARGIDWSNVDFSDRTDREIAEQLGVSITTVGLRRRDARMSPHKEALRTNWQAEQRLGKVPDKELAAALGVTYGTVRAARQRLGIQPVTTERQLKAERLKEYLFRAHREDPSLTNRQLARQIGCSEQRVCALFRQYGGRIAETPYQRSARLEATEAKEAGYQAWLKSEAGQAIAADFDAAQKQLAAEKAKA